MSRPYIAALLLMTAAMPTFAEPAGQLTASGDMAPLPAVRLIDPTRAADAFTRTFYGRIAARETAALSFEIGGRLVAFTVREGESVAAGDVIARLDPDPLDRAVERAEASLRQAMRDYDRATRLAATNAGPQVLADDAETARDLADVALRDARAAQVDGVMRAPFDGLVARRIAATFSNVAPGQPILDLHDMSEVRVEIEAPERVLLRAGDPRGIAFAGEGPGGAPVPLELAEFEAQTGAVGQSFRISLTVPPEVAAGLLPGASMTVTADLPMGAAGATLPPGAILANTLRGFEVMVFRPDPGDAGAGTVERREIAVQAPNGTDYIVEGLSGDERVVAAGAHLLQDGQQVRVYSGLTVEDAR